MKFFSSFHSVVVSPTFRRAELGVLFILLALLFVRRINYVQFFKDESGWIADSRYLDALLVGDLSVDTWSDAKVLSDQSPLPRYIIGLSRRLAGYKVEDLNLHWRSSADYQTNVVEDRVPSPGLLWWSRFPMAVLAAASGVLIFWLINQVFSRLAAYLWLLQYAISYYITATLCKAMAESPLLITVALAGVCGIFTLYESRRIASTAPVSISAFRSLLLWFLLFGICSGLAALAKLNGAFVIGAGLLLIAWVTLNYSGELSRSQRSLFALMAGSILIISAFATFVVLNPFLYPDPINRTILLYTDRLNSMTNQTQDFAEDSIDNFSERIQVVPRMVLQDLAPIRFTGSFWLNLVLNGVGVAVVAQQVRGWRRNEPRAIAGVTLLSLAITVAIPPLFTPLNWPRYYILPVIFSMLFAALGLAQFLTSAYAYARRQLATRALPQPLSTK